MNTLTVIVPTTGRATLAQTLESCADADEVIVIHDRAQHDRGYTARTTGMALARSSHLAFMDDDDTYTDGAISLMRDAGCDRPVIFKMDDPTWGILWRDPEVRLCNVGTPMIVVPNDPARLGTWEPWEADRCGDYTFIRGCAERMGEPVWRNETVCVVRPHEREGNT
jgi:glycosyltransferase involved in cell wall biosynthesis